MRALAFASRRSARSGTFIILPHSVSIVKNFFQVPSTFDLSWGAVITDSFYILPNLSIFVNCFFHLFWRRSRYGSPFGVIVCVRCSCDVQLEADARTARKRSCDTAFLIYQTGFHLSTPFSLIFWSFFFLCDSFRQFLECLKFPAFSAFRTYLILSKISFVFTSELIENSSIFSPHHLLFSEN